METPNYGRWSDLSLDILISVFGRLSYADFHRAKIVCRDWNLCSKQTLHRKTKGPRLVPSREYGYVLYNRNENKRFYKSKRDFSNTRFLYNSGHWFLITLDSESNLSIIDIFSEKRINLPPLDSIQNDHFTLKRIGETEFSEKLIKRTGRTISRNHNVANLKGHLWVNEKKNEEYTVAWLFHTAGFIAFCKNGEDYYGTIPQFEYRRMKRNKKKMTWPSSE